MEFYMSRAYTAEQIADLIDMICRDKESDYSDETKDVLKGVADYLLIHSQKSYEELRDEIKGQRMVSYRRKYPPFREELIDDRLKSQVH